MTSIMTYSSKSRQVRRKAINTIMLTLMGVAAVIVVAPLIWILVYVIRAGLPAINSAFFTQLPTPVGVPGGGIINALVGSLITVGSGALIAAPIGVLAGIYAATNPNTPFGLCIRFGTDVISGVPSIVMGIFAYSLVVLPQRHFSALSGGIVLSFIMVPIIIRTTEEMIKLVPKSLREGSLALGAAEWKTSASVILPAALNGVLTGLMLAIARAAGEAAPMLFTAFGNPFMNTDINQPIATLPHTIFVYAIAPYQDWHDKAWGTALVLITLVLLLNIMARLIVWWRVRRLGSVVRN
ncbi:MAG TPA: phosphate ABC transporter permease PstA [Anaerolineales bacterium]|nr:phosphate ABC transporter permease PstA [Anaerolineales bacterium]